MIYAGRRRRLRKAVGVSATAREMWKQKLAGESEPDYYKVIWSPKYMQSRDGWNERKK